MPALLTEEDVQDAVAAYREHGSIRAAARALEQPYGTMHRRLKRAAEMGLLLDTPAAMPGYRVSRVAEGPRGRTVEQKPELGPKAEVPAGHRVKGVSTLTDPSGNTIVQWVKTAEIAEDPVAVAEKLVEVWNRIVPAAKPVAPPAFDPVEALLTLVPANDLHIGMFSWRKETGVNWDLKIAEQVIGDALVDVVMRSPQSAVGVLLGGGDLLHADNGRNMTEKSGNILDVDGRYLKVLETAQRIKVRVIDAMLQHFGTVAVRILRGNHDRYSSGNIAHFLRAWYRNEPRVEVDCDPSNAWYWQHGQTMLAASHGDELKLQNLPAVMAARKPKMWGDTTYRYAHGFHVHHKSKPFNDTERSVICETHEAPIPQDEWHFSSGFLSGRSVQTITYHKEGGEYGRVIKGLQKA